MSGRYWTERDTFLREESRFISNRLGKELYYNDLFSVFDCCNSFYAMTDYRKQDGAYSIYKACPEMILKLVDDKDQWELFKLRAESEHRTVLLNEEGYRELYRLHSEASHSEGDRDAAFLEQLQKAMEKQKAVFENEGIVGTPEWRQRVAREVHQDVMEEKKKVAALPWYRKLFLSPSVAKKLKNENDLIYKTQNRLIYEEMDKKATESAGSVSRYTVRAFVVSLTGILLFYLLLYLHLYSIQFVPAALAGIAALVFLFRDDNADTRNMNARLVAWVVSIICIILALTAVMSMLQ